MKAIQIVLDEDLLTRVDKVARRRRVSRSAFIRESVEQTLGGIRLRELVEEEQRAYARKPASADERAAVKALSRAQDKVLAKLSKTDHW